jgi:hypothetical protein
LIPGVQPLNLDVNITTEFTIEGVRRTMTVDGSAQWPLSFTSLAAIDTDVVDMQKAAATNSAFDH